MFEFEMYPTEGFRVTRESVFHDIIISQGINAEVEIVITPEEAEKLIEALQKALSVTDDEM
jgi:phosphotransferase system HPr-like phosphotransfer protein